MAEHDGNGWVDCRCGSRHWGRHGAAGLLLLRGSRPDAREVLLQLRAAWTHQGGNWGLPGGARDSHEDPVSAALREAAEEAGVSPGLVTVVCELPGVDHGDWRYTYVVGVADGALEVSALTTETDELRWVPLGDVQRLPLHPAFGDAWPRLHAGLTETC
ncbi:MAG TPA: NUDIX domain-containing protein [Kineosporiaceae bacterium]|nr:NUDIX domain-containing protein [Kineosporiaceae bacterium]